jgi:hypothetical protein
VKRFPHDQLFGIPYPVSSIQYPVSSIQHPASGIQHEPTKIKIPLILVIKKPSDGGTTGLDSLSSKGRGGPFERVGVIYTELKYLSSFYLLI